MKGSEKIMSGNITKHFQIGVNDHSGYIIWNNEPGKWPATGSRKANMPVLARDGAVTN